jgi:threonine/homoserine/homoserine lactone efflux protein
LLLCAWGLGALVLAVPLLSWAVKAVGVAYLLWLAWKLNQARQLSEASAAALSVGFWQGVALQFVNIKAWMLALAIVSGWITGHADTTQRLAIVVPTMLAFAFTSNFLYATMGSLLRDWLRGPEDTGLRLRLFNRCMALVLVATALWMAAL